MLSRNLVCRSSRRPVQKSPAQSSAALVVPFVLGWLCLASLAPSVGQSADAELVRIESGELPFLISAPHGGNLAIPGVPPRTGEGLEQGPKGFVNARDGGTEELAAELARAIEQRFAKRPYLVVARSHRKYLDPNRPAEIAFENAGAKPTYEAYHGALEKFSSEIRSRFQRGLLLDLHGQGTSAETVYRGTQDGQTVALLTRRFGEAAHQGDASLFGQLKARGWKVFPDPLDGREQSGFRGGYIVRTYGGDGGHGLDAIQLEFGAQYRAATARAATAATLADALVDYAQRYLTVSATTTAPGRAPTTLATGNSASTPRPAWTKSKVRGAPGKPEPYRIQAAFPALQFQKPTSVEELPGANRLLVTEMSGKVYTFDRQAAGTRAELAGDLSAALSAELKGRTVSLFDAEPHPQFAKNRQIFLCYVQPQTGQPSGITRLSRFTLTADNPPRLAPDSEQVILTWPAGGHNGGCLEFGVDGLLYVSTGDGSGPNPPDGLTTGQDVSDLLGAVLRIDVDHPDAERAYSIPADNPFVNQPPARPEIWSYGLRNPWKFGIDPQTGDAFVADNGWESWELIHRLSRGSNCGWPIMEGRAALRSEVPRGPTPIVPPVMDHPHTEANSVIGGPVYRGKKLPSLAGNFIYGDYITGTIWAIQADSKGAFTHSTLVDTDLQIVAFTQLSTGEVLVLDYDTTGQIYELLPSDIPDTSATFPRRLSETGLFDSLDTLRPAPGVVPYDVRTSRWLDGAQAQRWVAIPGDATIELAADPTQTSKFPEGTVFVKHLSWTDPRTKRDLRLETQLLHLEHGVWRPYSYLWDEDGKDAQLVDPLGAQRPLSFAAAASAPSTRGAAPAAPPPATSTSPAAAVDRTWHVNAVNECKLCHNAGARYVLGFTRHQLDRPVAGGSPQSSQLASLAQQKVIASVESPVADDPFRLVDPRDPSQPLDARARSYLHANCGMCHHPGGNAIVSFYLRRDLPFAKLNTNKGTGIGTFGMQSARVIAPGDPYRSVLFYRLSKLGYARMPYIGSRVVDSAGVTLIEQWIRSLPADGAQPLSPLTQNDSAESVALRTLTGSKDADPAGRDSAVASLLSSTEGALALMASLHGGKLSPEAVEPAIAAGAGSKSGDLRGLFETFIPESKRRPTLGPKFDPQLVLARQGDQGRGQLIFHSDGARCRACHEIDDKAQSIGPTLKEINKKYAQPADLLQHVVQPSLKIDEPFAAYTLLTDDGRAITGLLERQSDAEVVLRTAERRVVRVPRKEIDELRRSPKSLMPDGVLSDLTAQEAADLFAYIRSLGAAP